jgi:hypothetical protein
VTEPELRNRIEVHIFHSHVRAPLTLRLRYWWSMRRIRRKLGPLGVELVHAWERKLEREFIFGKDAE